MNIGSIIKTGVKFIFKSIAENPEKTAVILGTAIGGTGAAIGTGKVIAANNLNKKAQDIYESAIKRNDKSEEEVKIVLETLAEKQVYAASLFDEFSDIIEKIQQRPEGLFQGKEFEKLPKYDAKEFKILTNNARIFLDTLGGAAIGTIAGSATIGFQTAIFGFSAFAAGAVLFFKGNNLKKKADESYERAEEIRQEVDSIISFHSLLMEAAGQIVQSMNWILPQFEFHLSRIKDITSQSTDWNNYTELEEVIIENSVLLACCLNGLCTINLTKKSEKGKDIVDSDKVQFLQDESHKIIQIIDSYKFGLDNIAAMETPD